MRSVAFDFDGVVHKYSKGWNGGDIYDDINEEIVGEMNRLMNKGFGVLVLSTRDSDQINEWFREKYVSGVVPFETKVVPKDVFFWKEKGVVGITSRKLPALVYVDDRAVNFDGDIRKMKDQMDKIIFKKK